VDSDPPGSDLSGLGRPGKIPGYRLDRCVARGSTAAVYLALDKRLRRQVAVKVLAPDPDRDAAVRTRMIREVRAASAVDHPHILPVYEADEADGTMYVAMRYASGGNASSLLSRLGPLPPGYAWRIVFQIASALDAAHVHGLIHRDVKPANILLDAGNTAGRPLEHAGDQEPDHAYLSDFGMSKAFPPGQVIAADQIGGTLHYLAPEQIEGRAPDGRADLYSLACTGFELLCGTPPFGPDQGLTLMYAQLYASPPAVTARCGDLPAAVDSVLATALAKDPADRYPNCGRFAEELRAALGLRSDEPAGPSRSRKPFPADLGATDDSCGPDPEPPDPEPPDPERSAPRRRALRPVLATAAVVAVIVAAASGVVLSKRSAPGRPAASSPAASSRPLSASASGGSAASSPPGASTPPASVLAARQAAALGTLLTSSAAARTALHQAVDQVGTCANLSGAVSQLQNVVNQRASEYGRASALPTSALPDGVKVKSELITALSSSLTADREYLTWAQQQLAGGCTPSSQSSAYNAAFSTSQLADAAKQAFVQVWNPVAARYGIAQNSARNI
jgi:serine/threonine protein kinase